MPSRCPHWPGLVTQCGVRGRDGLQNPCSSAHPSLAPFSGGSSDPHSPLPPEVDRPRGSRQTACGVGLEKENAACGWCPCSAGNSVEGMGDWNPEGPIGQIVRTTAESQKIVAARPLYFLQHRVRAKSSARDLPQ
ncbi:hypothetical protein COCOBI_03-3220 [Coccomyxa sp. Obi]|nr:hypothetical protein COCOBI_03-3220 [Coccomyxa sp. Obi]